MQTPPRSKGGGQIILTKPLALQIGMALTLRSAGPVKQAARPVDTDSIDDITAQRAKHGSLHQHHPLIAQPDAPIAQRELQRPRQILQRRRRPLPQQPTIATRHDSRRPPRGFGQGDPFGHVSHIDELITPFHHFMKSYSIQYSKFLEVKTYS